MNLFPDIERQTPEKIIRMQEEKLEALIQYVAANSSFYKSHFSAHGIKPDSIKTLRDLLSIPPVTKDDLQRRNWDFLCVPKSQIAEFTSTSGTLGKPVTIALTESDLQRLAYNEAISFACADGTSEDIFQLMLTLDRQFMAGVAYYHGIRKLGAAVVRVGPGVPAMQWDTIQRLKPTILVAVPSFLLKLIDFALHHNVDLNQCSVKKAICIGESIRSADLDLNAIGRKISEHWNIKLYSTYASTEMQTAFTECSHGVGGHLHPELLIVELLDQNNQPVQPGESGEIVITTLGIEGMPLLRYKTGDMSRSYFEECKCGRTTLRLGPIVGRKQQLIKLKGTTIYPPGIFELLNDVDLVQDYVVEVFAGDFGTDELRLYIAINGEEKASIERRLVHAFQSRLRVVPEMVFTSSAELEKLQLGKGERKIRRFIDNREGLN
jgi:phenylacetate-CoA ligase